MVRFLCRNNANINARNIEGQTPLWTFVDEGNVEIVKEALACRADPNIYAYDGSSVLKWVIDADRFENFRKPSYRAIIRLLKAHGAQISQAERAAEH
jgi:ankyrin repeat protein